MMARSTARLFFTPLSGRLHGGLSESRLSRDTPAHGAFGSFFCQGACDAAAMKHGIRRRSRQIPLNSGVETSRSRPPAAKGLSSGVPHTLGFLATACTTRFTQSKACVVPDFDAPPRAPGICCRFTASERDSQRRIAGNRFPGLGLFAPIPPPPDWLSLDDDDDVASSFVLPA